MPLEIRCPSCKRGYRADEKYSGRQFKCRRCGTAVAVPSLGEGTGISPLIIIQAWLGVAFAVMPAILLTIIVIELIENGEIPSSIFDRADMVPLWVLSLISG